MRAVVLKPTPSSEDIAHRTYSVLLLVIVALGAALRLVDLAGPSLWLDEILHLEVTRSLGQQPWWSYLFGVRETMGGTENGALYYGLQALGQRLAPGDLGVRLLPALLGTATLPLMARAGTALAGRLVGLTAAFLLAVSPLHVYFSREGRPYYLLMALALVLLYALLRRNTTTGRRIAWAASVGGAYIGLHAMPLLLSFLALSGILLLWDRGTNLGALLRAPGLQQAVAAATALALAYGLYMTRSDTNTLTRVESEVQVEIQESPVFETPFSVKSARRFLASMTTSGDPSVVLGWRAGALCALALIGLLATARERPRECLAAVGMFVLPAALSVAALATVGRWYGIRYTSSALPAFLLLVALGVVAVAHRLARVLAARTPGSQARAATWSLICALLLAVAAPNVVAARNDPYSKLDWRAVAEFFDQVAISGEPILIANDWPKISLGHYLQQRGLEVEFVSLWESAERGAAEVEARGRGWLLTAGYRKSNEVRAWMHGFVPVLKRREEEMALFFFPDMVTLLESRFAAGKGALFEQLLVDMGRRFDFGGGEITLQGSGWSYPENDGAGTDFQWATGEQAELGAPIGQPRDAILRFRARPFSYPDAPPQQVEVWLDQTLLARLELPPDWSEHEVPVTAAAWEGGANIVYLRFSNSMRPAAVLEGSTDRRPLAAAFDYFEIVPAG